MRIRSTRGRCRRGVEVLELILVLPVLIIVLVGTFEYASLTMLQAAITHAATVGAREAGKCPHIDIVLDVVDDVLSASCITLDDADDSGTKVVLEVYGEPDQVFGDANLTCNPPDNDLNENEVRVTICIALSSTGFCNALADWGFSMEGCVIRASSLVKKEII
jgi:Flp pilus assembly protein TadG